MINENYKMATELPTTSTNGQGQNNGTSSSKEFTVKTGLARMLKGGVIMDVVNAEQVTFFLLLLGLLQLYLTKYAVGNNSGGSWSMRSHGFGESSC